MTSEVNEWNLAFTKFPELNKNVFILVEDDLHKDHLPFVKRAALTKSGRSFVWKLVASKNADEHLEQKYTVVGWKYDADYMKEETHNE